MDCRNENGWEHARMRIDPKETIAGIPIVRVRDFMRPYAGRAFTTRHAMASIEISHLRANDVIQELVKRAWIVASDPDNGRTKTQDWYRATFAGAEFSAATAFKAIIRSTADAHIADLLKRVAHVESLDSYLYRVATIVAYGSYLTTDEHLFDVDLSITLAPKMNDPAMHQAMEEKQSLDEEKKGTPVIRVGDRLSWPKNKVLLYLKNKSRVLSFREHGKTYSGEPYATIFEAHSLLR